MKDLYRQLEIAPHSSHEDIYAAIQAKRGSLDNAEDVEHILGDPDRRKVYDRTHTVVSTVGILRSNLGLTQTEHWISSASHDFERPVSNGSELDKLGAQPSRPRKPSTEPDANPLKPPRRRTNVLVRLLLLTVAVVVIACFFLPWPHYQFAKFNDTPDSYYSFYRRFPNSEYAQEARERRSSILDNATWKKSRAENSLSAYQRYLERFPEGKHSYHAISIYSELLAESWGRIRDSRSPETIRQFLEDHPDSGKEMEAQLIINNLHRDWAWVREQDKIDDYQRFQALVPNHPHSEWVESRIIDLEIAHIAASDHGALPPTTPTRRIPGAASAFVRIENATRYQLTVLYSGPESRRFILGPNSVETTYFPIGTYHVAASVDAGLVSSYYGIENLSGGEYDVQYYIDTEVSPYRGHRRQR